MPIRHILVPTDFSSPSEAAAQLGHAIARRHGGKLTLLHVSEFPGLAIPAPEPFYLSHPLWPRLWELEKDRIQGDLETLRDKLASSGAEIDTVVAYERGDTVAGVLAAAREHAVDLITMGAHGADLAPRSMFGSVAARVSRQAPCPVLITRSQPALEQATVGAFQRILVAVDYSPVSLSLVECALQVATDNAEIVVLHVWQQLPLLSANDEAAAVTEQIRAAEAQRMEALMDRVPQSSQTVSGYIEIGSPADRILAQAQERGTDLLVVGSHARTGVERVIGTVADRVLRHAETCVLLVPTPPAS